MVEVARATKERENLGETVVANEGFFPWNRLVSCNAAMCAS